MTAIDWTTQVKGTGEYADVFKLRDGGAPPA